MLFCYLHIRRLFFFVAILASLLVVAPFGSASVYAQHFGTVSNMGVNAEGYAVIGGNDATLFDILTSDQINGYETFVARWRNVDGGVHESKVELVEYSDSHVLFDTDQEFGDASRQDDWMLFVRFAGDVTVYTNVTLTANGRKRGMYMHIPGQLVNHGTISMTARGAVSEGQNVLLFDEEFVPAEGGAGGDRVYASAGGSSTYRPGRAGADGVTRSTGGGASGGNRTGTAGSGYSGRGSAGTSYSGGSGGGGRAARNTSNAGHASANGGRGGSGYAWTNSPYRYSAGGGAGNPGGSRGVHNGGSASNGHTGTGGLLALYAHKVNNHGIISSDGSQGGNASHISAGGGGSGGGSVNIFASQLNNSRTIRAEGGSGGTASGNANGGRGGDGVTTVNQSGLRLQASHPDAGEQTGGGLKRYGESVPVSTTVKAGYTFQNWTDQDGAVVSNSPSFDYSMPAAGTKNDELLYAELTANFSADEYGLDFSLSDAEAGKLDYAPWQEKISAHYPGEPIDLTVANYGGYELQSLTDGRTTWTPDDFPKDPEMVSHMGFDADQGTSAFDASLYGHTGQVTGASWTSEGRIGGGMNFSGNGQYIDQGSSHYFNFGDDEAFSVQLWAKANALKDRGGLVSKIGSRGGPYTFMTVLHQDGRLGVYSPDAGWRYSESTRVEPDKWYHLAFVFDGDQMHFFVDGEPVGSQPFTYRDNFSHRLLTGSWHTNSSYEFSGTMDEVKVYSRALSQDEVRSLYGSNTEGYFRYEVDHEAAVAGNQIELFAEYEASEYTLAFDRSHEYAGYQEDLTDSQPYLAGETVQLRARIHRGYELVYWTDGYNRWTLEDDHVTLEDGYLKMPYVVDHAAADEDGEITLWVEYATQESSLHPQPYQKHGGVVTDLTAKEQYLPNEPIEVIGTVSPHYTFSHFSDGQNEWYPDDEEVSQEPDGSFRLQYRFDPPEPGEPVFLYAHYDFEPVSIAFGRDLDHHPLFQYGGYPGYERLDPCPHSAPDELHPGEPLRIFGNPHPGYRVPRWRDRDGTPIQAVEEFEYVIDPEDADGGGEIFFEVNYRLDDDNSYLVENFYSLTFDRSHELGGEQQDLTGESTYIPGQPIRISSTERAGYTFTDWSDGIGSWQPEDNPLRSHWPMEEGTGQTIADAGSSGNDGVASGTTWTSSPFGNGLHFDGNASLTVNHDPSLVVNEALALSLWVRPEFNSETSGVIAGKGRGAYQLEVEGLDFIAYVAGQTVSVPAIFGQWQHVVLSWDGSTIRVYVNGQQRVSSGFSGSVPENTNDLIMGTNFTGDIAEVRLYDRGLSSYDASALYQGNVLPVVQKTADDLYEMSYPLNPAAVEESGEFTLTAVYDTQESELLLDQTHRHGGKVTDETGKGSYWPLEEVELQTTVNEHYTFLYWSDGHDTWGSDAPEVEEQEDGSYTLLYTIDPSEAGEDITVTAHYDTEEYILELDRSHSFGGRPEYERLDPCPYASSGYVQPGEPLRLFSNPYPGYELLRWEDEHEVIVNTETDFNYTVAPEDADGSGDIYFKAVYEQARYDVILSLSHELGGEVEDLTGQADYGGGELLAVETTVNDAYTLLGWSDGVSFWEPEQDITMGYWSLNDGAGNIATDHSTFANHGDVHGASWTNGVFGDALSFDGGSDRVVIPYDGHLAMSESMTLAGWIRPSGSADGATPATVAGKGTDTYLLSMEGLNLTGYINGQRIEASVTANQWQYVVMTYDGSTQKLYIDGDLQESRSLTGGVQSQGHDFVIGEEFPGKIDEVRLLSRALTEEEVNALFSSNVLPVGVSTGDDTYQLNYVTDPHAADEDQIIILEAVYETDESDLTLDQTHKYAGEVVDVKDASPYAPYETIEVNATVNEHYTFSHWSVGNTDWYPDAPEVRMETDGSYTLEFVVTPEIAGDDIEIMAHYQGDEYTLTLDRSLSFAGNPSFLRQDPCPYATEGYLQPGEPVSISANVNTGYSLKNWVNDQELEFDDREQFEYIVDPGDADEEGDIYIKAVFEQVDYQLSLEKSHEHGGDLEDRTGRSSYGGGEPVILTASVEDGYTFENWTDGLNTWYPEGDIVLGHWPFNEGAGDIVRDTTVHEHHGVVRGGSWINGPFGGALDFDAQNDEVVIQQTDALEVSGAMSISAWIRPRGPLYGSGGVITEQDGYIIHAFENTGEATFVAPLGVEEVEVLVVAGGGGGENMNEGGGGGAGGLIFYGSETPSLGNAYHVGAGNSIDVFVGNGGSRGNNGQDSRFGDLVALGGGSYRGSNGLRHGGSGVGAGGTGLQPTSDSGGFGHDGGVRTGGSPWEGGGGGGAGGRGNNGTSHGGAGGAGLYYGNVFGDHFGDNGWFASGGSGGGEHTAYAPPPGGGGRGGLYTTQAQRNAMPNTGGGGGGNNETTSNHNHYRNAGSGGSGVVLVRYPKEEAVNPVIQSIAGHEKESYQLNVEGDEVVGHINGTRIAAPAITDQWQHVVMTYDGSTQRLYINGELENSRSLSGTISPGIDEFLIGNNYRGGIDEVRMVNRALSGEEVGALYQSNVVPIITLTEDGEYQLIYVINPAAADENSMLTLTANYSADRYALNVSQNLPEAGNISGTGSYYPGETVTLSTSVEYGYNFMGWFDEEDNLVSEETSLDTIMPPGNVDLHAEYIQRPNLQIQMLMYHSIDGEPYAGGTIDAGNFDVGEKVEVSAGSVFGYQFFEWATLDPLTGEEYGGELENRLEPTTNYTMPTNDVILTARFMIESNMGRLLEVEAEPDTTWGEVYGTGQYFGNQEVSIRAEPATGYTFDYWHTPSNDAYIDDPFAPETSYFMPPSGDAVVYAVFKPDPSQYNGLRLVASTAGCDEEAFGQVENLSKPDQVEEFGGHDSGLPVFGGEDLALYDIMTSPQISGHERFVARWRNPGGGINESKVEFLEYSQDVVFNQDTELGRGHEDDHMLFVRFGGNVSIDPGVTVRPDKRKKGMYWLVNGDIRNQGNISMTARGAHASGQNVVLLNHPDDSFEFVPAAGAAGGGRRATSNSGNYNGRPGNDGVDRRSGGGGGGALSKTERGTGYTGAGARASSFSGGSGGGAVDMNSNGGQYASAGSSNGGPGGAARSRRTKTGWVARYAGGGAGNTGGGGRYTFRGDNTGSYHSAYNGESGTGGLLVLFAHEINNAGSILSEGSAGGPGRASGGSSGGGSINFFVGNRTEPGGNISTSGGVSPSASATGGRGGQGSITVSEYGHNVHDTITVRAVPAEGYEFIQWACADSPGLLNAATEGTDEEGYPTITFVMPNEPVTLEAIFDLEPDHYSLKVQVDTDEEVIELPSIARGEVVDNLGHPSYEAGDILSITATPYEGYRFEKFTSSTPIYGRTEWAIDPNHPDDPAYSSPEVSGGGLELTEPVNLEIEMPDDCVIMTAHFRPEFGLFDLDVLPFPDAVYGEARDVTDAAPYVYGRVVTVTAEPDTGFRFVEWESDGAGVIGQSASPTTTFTMPENDEELRAVFEVDTDQTFNLTVDAVSPGDCGVTSADLVDGQGSFNALDEVTLYAASSTGHELVEWTGDTQYITGGDVGTNTITVTMPGEDIHLTAEFKMTEYDLVIRSNEAKFGYTLPDGRRSRNMNDRTNIRAVELSGFEFSHWSEEGGGAFDNYQAEETHYTMPASVATVTANFIVDVNQFFTVNMATDPLLAGDVINHDADPGGYNANTPIFIEATVNPGYTFDKWTSSHGGVFDEAGQLSTTFTMPGSNVTLTATYTPIEYRLDLDVDPHERFGSVSGAGTDYHVHQVRPVKAEPKQGYRFVRWEGDTQYLEGEVDAPDNAVNMPAGDVSLVAHFEVDDSQVFPLYLELEPDAGGSATDLTGGGPYMAESVVELEAVAAPGYRFSGWSGGDGGEISASGDPLTTFRMPGNEATLRANFTPINYRVTMQGDPGTWVTATDVTGESTYHVDQTLRINTVPDVEGLVFDQWSDDDAGGSFADPGQASTTYTMPPSDVTLTARYVGNNSKVFTLSLARNVDTWGEVEGDGDYVALDIANLVATPAEGAFFQGWYNAAGTQISTNTFYDFEMPPRDTTLTARFLQDGTVLYPLTILSNPEIGGSSTGAGSYAEDETVSIEARPNDGYAFTHWSSGIEGIIDDPNSRSTYLTMPIGIDDPEGVTITAHFETVPLDLDVFAEPDHRGTVTGTGTYVVHDEVEVQASPHSGYMFSGWTATTGNFQEAEVPVTIYTMPGEHAEVRANFDVDPTQEFPLTVDVADAGAGTATNTTLDVFTLPDPGPYTVETPVTAEARPAPGYEFSHWETEDNIEGQSLEGVTNQHTGYNAVSLDMPGNSLHLVAHFAMKGLDVDLSVESPQMGSVEDISPGDTLYNLGDDIRVKATPNTGYRFVEWVAESNMDGQSLEGNTSPSTGANQLNFTMPANNVFLVAVFEPDPAQTWELGLESEPASFGTLEYGNTDGAGDPDEGPYVVEDSISVTATPTEGHHFHRFTSDRPIEGRDEWYFDHSFLSGDVDEAVVFDFPMPAGDTELTAHFMANPYLVEQVVVPHEDYGTITDISPVEEDFFNPEDEVVLMASASQGYRFEEWVVEGSEEIDWESRMDEYGNYILTFMMPAGDVRVEAHFSVDTSLFWELNVTPMPEIGGSAEDLTASGPYNAETVVDIIADTVPGYVFDHWESDYRGHFEDPYEPATTFRTPGGHVTVTANLDPLDYFLTLRDVPDHRGKLEDISRKDAPHHVFDTITLRATPVHGYMFDRLTAGSELEGHAEGYEWTPSDPELGTDENGVVTFTFEMPPEDVEVTAEYLVDPTVFFDLNLHVEPAGWGTITTHDGETAYNAESLVTLKADTIEGFKFDRWTGDTRYITSGLATQDEVEVTMPAHDIDLTANYVIDYSVRFRVILENRFWFEGDLVAQTHLTSVNHPALQDIKVSAFAQHGYLFDHWSSDRGGLFADPFQMQTVYTNPPRQDTIAANFEVNQAIQYPLTINVYPDESYGSAATVDGASAYHLRQPVDVAAIPETGVEFKYWEAEGSGGYEEKGEFDDPTLAETVYHMPVFPVQNPEITAYFGYEEFDLNVEEAPVGSLESLSVSPELPYYHYDDSVNITAEVKPGYEFLYFFDGMTYWYPDDVSVSTGVYTLDYSMPDRDVQMKAVSEAIPYQLRLYREPEAGVFNPNAGGHLTGTASGTYYVDDEITLGAEPELGYYFDQWTGDTHRIMVEGDDLTSPDIVFSMPAGDVSLTADFGFHFHGGTGTASDPFTISTPQHLHNIRYYLGPEHAGLHFLQINDIDLSGSEWAGGNGWEPIGGVYGEEKRAFTAHFDGDHHHIRGMTIDRPDEAHTGLFGLTHGAVIENTRLEEVQITAGSYAGPLTGEADLDTHISRSYANGEMQGTATTIGMGGLVGRNAGGSLLEECFSQVELTAPGESQRLGGLVGHNHGSSLLNVYASGSVAGYDMIGGLVGYNQGGQVSYAYASGSVSHQTENGGGLLGRQEDEGTTEAGIEYSYWDVVTSGIEESVGSDPQAGLTTEEMYRYETFDSGAGLESDWNFESVWAIYDTLSYPFFGWQPRYLLWLEPEPDYAASQLIGIGAYDKGQTVEVEASSKHGYVFNRWREESSGDIVATNSIATYEMPDQEETLQAEFLVNPNAYFGLELYVSPEPDYGDVEGAGEYNAEHVQEIVAAPAPGYVFVEWTGDTEYIVEGNPGDPVVSVEMPPSTISLTAHFDVDPSQEFRLRFRSRPDHVGSYTYSGNGYYNVEDLIHIQAQASAGYRFSYWTSDVPGEDLGVRTSTMEYEMPGQDVWLTGNFEVDPDQTFNLSIIPVPKEDIGLDGSRYGIIEGGIGDHHVDKEVEIMAGPRSGFRFVEWRSADAERIYNLTNRLTVFTMPPYDTEIEAVFEIDPTLFYYVDLYTSPSNDAFGSARNITPDGDGPYNVLTEVQVEAVPEPGYSFSHWEVPSGQLSGVDLSGTTDPETGINTLSFYMEGRNIQLTAHFEPDQEQLFHLDITPNDPDLGTVSNVTEPGPYPVDTEVELRAIPEPGYEFLSWRHNDVEVSSDAWFTYSMPSEDVELIAHFRSIDQVAHSLELIPEAAHQGEVTGSGQYLVDEEIIIEASPRPGYLFTEWQDDAGQQVAGTVTHLFTMPDKDVTLHAHFELDPAAFYDLVLESSPRGYGTAVQDGDGRYQPETEVQLQAIPYTGYKFDRWAGNTLMLSGEPDDSGNVSPTFTMTGEDAYLRAEFAIDYTQRFPLSLSADEETWGEAVNRTTTEQGASHDGPYHVHEMVTVEAIPDEGFQFINWSLNGEVISSDPLYTFGMPAGPADVVAHFMPDDIEYYTVEVGVHASSTGNGQIDPAGPLISLLEGESVSFDILPDPESHIFDVIVDGQSRGIMDSYAFDDISQDHHLEVVFTEDAPVTHTVTATVDPASDGAGSLVPGGETLVAEGESITIDIIPEAGSYTEEVRVDGVNMGPISSYTFDNVQQAHQIEVLFTDAPVYTVHASVDENGSGTGGISPEGLTTLPIHSDLEVLITPHPDSHIEQVMVDDVAVGAADSYIFHSITGDHTIEARFSADPVVTHTITATVGEGSEGLGHISPAGDVPVPHDDDITFAITPEPGNYITSVLVNGLPVGIRDFFTFTNVHESYSIEAHFSGEVPETHTITATVLPPEGHEGPGEPETYGGQISPEGEVVFAGGDDATFRILPETGWHIAEVLADGVPVALVDEYTFYDVSETHSLEVRFTEDPVDTHTITATVLDPEGHTGPDAPASYGGRISPEGEVGVASGTNATFRILPDEGWHIAEVLADGDPVALVDEYTFYDVSETHS
ncbi:MAG: InlB B-repeat-containing protein, partial [Bacteroidales bacterium]